MYTREGMTTANMKLVMVDVPLAGELETAPQKLDVGEFVTARVVEISKLPSIFKGLCCSYFRIFTS